MFWCLKETSQCDWGHSVTFSLKHLEYHVFILERKTDNHFVGF